MDPATALDTLDATIDAAYWARCDRGAQTGTVDDLLEWRALHRAALVVLLTLDRPDLAELSNWHVGPTQPR